MKKVTKTKSKQTIFYFFFSDTRLNNCEENGRSKSTDLKNKSSNIKSSKGTAVNTHGEKESESLNFLEKLGIHTRKSILSKERKKEVECL